jgi:CheY-like chemotaxis protein
MLDLSMPGMNGQETLLALRKRASAVKVILSSGYTEADLSGRLEGSRPDAFLQKPYRVPALLDLVKRLLGSS